MSLNAGRDSRPFHTFFVLDTVPVEPSITSTQVIETLEWLFLTRGVPDYIRSDNGPEFIADVLKKWLAKNNCKTIFITPGSPWENPYIESFNGRFRDECLNCELFKNGRDAQIIVENWRIEYNTYRPHSSLGYKTPKEFAEISGNIDQAMFYKLFSKTAECRLIGRSVGYIEAGEKHEIWDC